MIIDIALITTFAAGSTCLGAGLIAWFKAPRSVPAIMFLAAMTNTFLALITGRLFILAGASHPESSKLFAKLFLAFAFIALTFLWELTLFSPVERKIVFRPPNALGLVTISTIAVSLFVAWAVGNVEFDTPAGTTLNALAATMLTLAFVVMGALGTIVTVFTRSSATEEERHSSMIYLFGLWLVAVTGTAFAGDIALGHKHPPDVDALTRIALILGVTISALLYGSSIARGSLIMGVSPAPERAASAAKAKFNLLHRRVYLVEESKPDFSINLFSDILKGRCYDCEDDESFVCESVQCASCGLRCPCKTCKKYKSRTQGLVVTRQFPPEVRHKFFLQTTPIIWLSTVAGKDNMDPAKLTLLTDYLVNFMEKSQNGVLHIDGIEYLITSNDFPRVLKAVDKWTETAMTTSNRLIISVDPKAFEEKDIALLERNREVVRPDARERWQVFPERI